MVRECEQKFCIVKVCFNDEPRAKEYSYVCTERVLVGDLVETPPNEYYRKGGFARVVYKHSFPTNSLRPNIYGMKRIVRVVEGERMNGSLRDTNSYETIVALENIEKFEEKFREFRIKNNNGVDPLTPKYFFGMCYDIWHWKKRFLKEKYDIDWKSPAECNPEVHFD